MDQIKWCLNQKTGIEIVEPSDNLKDAYFVKTQDALDTLKTSKKTPAFLVKCKNIVLDQKEITEIRARVSSVKQV